MLSHRLLGTLYRTPRLRLGLWYGMAGVAVAVDFATGPFVQFPIAYVVPVALAAWFEAPIHARFMAVALPALRFAFVKGIWTVPWDIGYSVVNAGIRIGVLSLLAYLISRVAEHDRAVAREVQLLEGLLPICSYCKRIRDRDQAWQPLETYLRVHTDLAPLSHGLCPDCARQHFPEPPR